MHAKTRNTPADLGKPLPACHHDHNLDYASTTYLLFGFFKNIEFKQFLNFYARKTCTHNNMITSFSTHTTNSVTVIISSSGPV